MKNSLDSSLNDIANLTGLLTSKTQEILYKNHKIENLEKIINQQNIELNKRNSEINERIIQVGRKSINFTNRPISFQIIFYR